MSHPIRPLRGPLSLALFLSLAAAPSSAAQVQLDKLTAADASEADHFGVVAIHGGLAAIGAPDRDAPLDSGAVYLFESRAGDWVETQVLRPSDPVASAGFGTALEVRDELVVVSAPGATGSAVRSGAVYVFERDAQQAWVQTAKLTALGGASDDRFGASLDLWQERVAVGAPGVDEGAPDAGAGYVFERLGGQWIQTAHFPAPEPLQSDRFGASSAIDGDFVILGADGDDGLAIDAGAAHAYRRSSTGWSPLGTLLPSGGTILGLFGRSVALDGEVALVGSPGSQLGGHIFGGAVHRFEFDGEVWSEVGVLLAPDTALGDRFGETVALSSLHAVIGATGRDTGGHDRAGGAYVFGRVGTGFDGGTALSADDASPRASFGSALALDGDRLFVGADFDSAVAEEAGAAYVFGLQTLADPYCFCDLDAPCENADAAAGCVNASGRGAALDASGSASVASDDLVLHVTGLPPQAANLLYMGAGSMRLPLGDGLRCVDWGGVGIFRFGIALSNVAGESTHGPGIVAESHARFGAYGGLLAGQRRNFQAWYRDPAGPCGGGHNQSHALAITFRP